MEEELFDYSFVLFLVSLLDIHVSYRRISRDWGNHDWDYVGLLLEGL